MSNENKDLEATDPELRDDSEGARTLPVLPVRDTVLFPHAVLPLTVGRESSVQLINSLGEDKTIVVVAQREARVDSPQPTDLFCRRQPGGGAQGCAHAQPEPVRFCRRPGAREGHGVHPVDAVHARDGGDDPRNSGPQEFRD